MCSHPRPRKRTNPGISHYFWLPASCFKRCVAPMLRKNFRSPNFRGPSWPKKVPETNRESREFPITFGSPRRASNAAWRPCFVKISGSKIFADHLSKKKVPKTTLQQQSSQDNPRIPGIYHNFWLPASCFKRCVAPMLRKNFRDRNFRGPSWTKKVPRTNRESREFPTTFGSPRCASNAAWRPCFGKMSVSKIFADQVGGRRFQGKSGNPANLPQFFPPLLRA